MSPERKAWHHMRQVCSNPNSGGWRKHGAQGEKVCKRWLNFNNFLTDVGLRPSSKHGLRKLGPGDFGPGNTKWCVKKVGIFCKGEFLTPREWSDKLEVPIFEMYECASELGSIELAIEYLLEVGFVGWLRRSNFPTVPKS